ncbi:MAG: response regulator [Candidatus Cloacimonetes bacterium]|nr:response regulator [Candidatus Cloacimonadota bacterium]
MKISETKPQIPLDELKILMAEDSSVNRRVLHHLLEKIGCRADMAENGRLALEMAKSKNYDIIFLDLWMPEMDGLEAAKAIRALDKKLYPSAGAHLIAMTADTMQGVREQCMASGMNDYVTKPITQDSLLESLTNRSLNAD